MNFLLFLAQAAADVAAPAADAGAPAGPVAPSWLQLLVNPLTPLILVIVALMFFSGSTRRKQERERKALLDSLKKGDQVRLIGGEFGTVADVRGNKVLIKVDESSNTKILYAREAVQAVEKDESK